jgi:hypothetical protein
MSESAKPAYVLAARFSISRESARYFLGRVQKRFIGRQPPHGLILECVQGEGYESLPEPHVVAAMLYDRGMWDQPLRPPPPPPQEEKDGYF